ncbi:MAG: hypothetical protein IPK71_05180 [Myxococcales bacterium]|nr:hypothetical protein [Myxococcales bacterium]
MFAHARLLVPLLVVAMGACATSTSERSGLDLPSPPECDDPTCSDASRPPLVDEGRGTPDATPAEGSRAPEDAATAREPGPADDCRPTELAGAPTLVVRPGGTALFSVDLGNATHSFASGCVGAFGPDRVQPISVVGARRIAVAVDSTRDVSGDVVLYAKASCGAPVDLACSARGTLEVPVTDASPIFLTIDTTAPQPATARVTVTIEAR